MRARDVIAQLLTRLPLVTDKFSDTIVMASALHAEPTLTINTTGAHGLVVGNYFHLVGTKSPISITSFTRAGTVGTITFSRAHDRVLESFAPTITTQGAVESQFNGTFTILSVPTRTTMTVLMADSGPTTSTGTRVAVDADSYVRSYNRLFSVASITDEDTFTATTSITGADAPDIAAATLRVKPRISGAVTLDRAVETYTRQGASKFWAYVVMGDVTASRGLEHKSDAVDRQLADGGFRQQVVSPFSVVVFAPATDDVAARRVRDEMSELWAPVCRSLLGSRFPSQLASSLCGEVNFVGHGMLDYQKGYYVHGFAFQAVEELGFNDTIGYNDSVAFRDVDYTMTPDLGAPQGQGKMTGTANLDG